MAPLLPLAGPPARRGAVAAAAPDPAAAEAAVLDPTVVGAKAAALGRARMAGLPVAPGYVMPVAEGVDAVRAGAETLEQGERGRARRAVLAVPVGAEQGAALRTAVARLGGRVIVRSSSPLEGDPRWSGAFASLGEVGPGDIEVAVRSCRASAFAADPLERAEHCGIPAERLALAILIQPELSFTAGGTARLTTLGTPGTPGPTPGTPGPTPGERAGGAAGVEIHGVAGHPAALLSGWGDALTPETGLAELIGEDAVRRIACLARATHRATGANHLEWGLTNNTIVLLQASNSRRLPRPAATPASTGTPAPGEMPRPAGIPAALGRRRLAGDSWEVADVLALGARAGGARCVPGGAYGPLRYVRPHDPAPPGRGHILVADRPRPALAPLLFGAAGLVCTGGPAASHLGEVARSLGVPMLVGVPVEAIAGPLAQLTGTPDRLAAIDAQTAELAVLPAATGPSDAPADTEPPESAELGVAPSATGPGDGGIGPAG